MFVQDDSGIFTQGVLVDRAFLAIGGFVDFEPIALADRGPQIESIERVHQQDVFVLTVQPERLYHRIESFQLGDDFLNQAQIHFVQGVDVGRPVALPP